jgi:hypothetical protein
VKRFDRVLEHRSVGVLAIEPTRIDLAHVHEQLHGQRAVIARAKRAGHFANRRWRSLRGERAKNVKHIFDISLRSSGERDPLSGWPMANARRSR